MTAKRSPLAPLLGVSVIALANHPLRAEEAVPTASLTLPEVTVEGAAEAPSIPLAEPTGVASALDLSVAETPNAVEVITQERMQREGARNLIEAYRSAAGVSAGNLPGEPGVTTLRGFSRAATGYMIDGMRAIDPLLLSRNYDTWSFERIEILKGPASVTHGVGSLAGAINLVTKKPSFEDSSQEALLSYGSFDSWRAAAGGNQLLSDRVAVRADAVVGQSGGYVDDTDSRTGALTTGILVKANDRLTLSAAADYFHDRFTTPYQGAPLLPGDVARSPSSVVTSPDSRVIDRAVRRNNYNVTDGRMDSDTAWLRTTVEYRIDADWKLVNELGYFDAERFWANSEDFTYDPGSGLLDRSTTKITHDHRFTSERLYASRDGEWAGRRNRFAGGVEYVTTDLSSIRRFGSTTAVDPFDPVRGSFPPDTPANFDTRVNFDSAVDTVSAFIEDALNVTPGILLIGGVRHERIDLDREIFDVTAGTTNTFGRDFDATSWRLGTVVDAGTATQFFASYNEATSPVTALLLSNQARAAFDLTTGTSVEAGVKTKIGPMTWTASIYQIDQDDILTRDPANFALTIQGGSQRSRGVELDMEWWLTPRWRLNGNAAHVAAEYTELLEAGGADREGNRPPNVPATLLNLNTDYRLAAWPITLGAAVHHAGNFYTDTANSIRVDGHTTLDASASYRIGPHLLTLRGRNLTDAFYADWSGYAPDMIYLAPPRSVDLTWAVVF